MQGTCTNAESAKDCITRMSLEEWLARREARQHQIEILIEKYYSSRDRFRALKEQSKLIETRRKVKLEALAKKHQAEAAQRKAEWRTRRGRNKAEAELRRHEWEVLIERNNGSYSKLQEYGDKQDSEIPPQPWAEAFTMNDHICSHTKYTKRERVLKEPEDGFTSLSPASSQYVQRNKVELGGENPESEFGASEIVSSDLNDLIHFKGYASDSLGLFEDHEDYNLEYSAGHMNENISSMLKYPYMDGSLCRELSRNSALERSRSRSKELVVNEAVLCDKPMWVTRLKKPPDIRKGIQQWNKKKSEVCISTRGKTLQGGIGTSRRKGLPKCKMKSVNRGEWRHLVWRKVTPLRPDTPRHKGKTKCKIKRVNTEDLEELGVRKVSQLRKHTLPRNGKPKCKMKCVNSGEWKHLVWRKVSPLYTDTGRHKGKPKCKIKGVNIVDLEELGVERVSQLRTHTLQRNSKPKWKMKGGTKAYLVVSLSGPKGNYLMRAPTLSPQKGKPKLWNTHHRPELVVQACRKSVYDMGLDYLDLYLIHWPIAFQEGEDKFPRDDDGRLLHEDLDYLLTYREMEQCVRYGLARSIGVANFNSEQIFRVLGVAVIKPVVNQIECHPYLNQTNLIRFCNKRGILVTASSPLGAPNLVPGISGTPNLLSDARLEPLAKKYNKSPAQIILRYHVQRGTVPLPKVTDRDHMIEDLQIFDFDLSEGDMSLIDVFDNMSRFYPSIESKDDSNYPFCGKRY